MHLQSKDKRSHGNEDLAGSWDTVSGLRNRNKAVVELGLHELTAALGSLR